MAILFQYKQLYFEGISALARVYHILDEAVKLHMVFSLKVKPHSSTAS